MSSLKPMFTYGQQKLVYIANAPKRENLLISKYHYNK